MSTSIEKLRQEHQTILGTLKACREYGCNSIECQGQLEAFHTLLIEHLDMEDRTVYSWLRDEASGNKRVLAILDRFDDDLLELTFAAKEFFAASSREKRSRIEHIKDYGVFFILLKDHLDREETVLFPEYERLSNAS